MDIVKRIDDISMRMQSVPLSTILVQILPIALECGDYEGYSILSCWNKPLCKEKATNLVLLEQIVDVLHGEGIDVDEARRIVNEAHEKYLALRTVEKDKVAVFSAKEIEDKVKLVEEAYQSQKTPQGLHPVDAYYHTQVIDKSKASLLDNLDLLNRQYAVLQSYIVGKLTEFRRKAEMIVQQASSLPVSQSVSEEQEPIIFLSHRSSDKKYGDALEKLLVGMGVKNHQLIYTSHPLHKIPLGKNIYDYLRGNIGRKTFVIILWSNEYLESPACLNEMGAAWVMQTDYTNMYTPDFSFGNPKYHECAVDTRKMGAVLNGDAHCKASMIEFKNIISAMFNLAVDEQTWTYLLDEFITTITEQKEDASSIYWREF